MKTKLLLLGSSIIVIIIAIVNVFAETNEVERFIKGS